MTLSVTFVAAFWTMCTEFLKTMLLRYVRSVLACTPTGMYVHVYTYECIRIRTYVLELGQMLKFDFEYLFYTFAKYFAMAYVDTYVLV